MQVRRVGWRTSSWTQCQGRWCDWVRGVAMPSPLPSESSKLKVHNTIPVSNCPTYPGHEHAKALWTEVLFLTKPLFHQVLMHRSVLAVVIIFYDHSHYYWCSFWLPFNYWLILVEVPEFALVRGMYIEHIVVVLCGVTYLNYLLTRAFQLQGFWGTCLVEPA